MKSFLEGNLVEEKLNYSISLATQTYNTLPELVNTVEVYAARFKKYQIITVVNDILPWAQACIKFDGGAFEYKLKSFKKRLNREFFLWIFFTQMTNIRQYK